MPRRDHGRNGDQEIHRRGNVFGRTEESIDSMAAKAARLREHADEHSDETVRGIAEALEVELEQLRSLTTEMRAQSRGSPTIRSRIERIETTDVKEGMRDIGSGLVRAAQELGRGVSQAWTRISEKPDPARDSSSPAMLSTAPGTPKRSTGDSSPAAGVASSPPAPPSAFTEPDPAYATPPASEASTASSESSESSQAAESSKRPNAESGSNADAPARSGKYSNRKSDKRDN